MSKLCLCSFNAGNVILKHIRRLEVLDIELTIRKILNLDFDFQSFLSNMDSKTFLSRIPIQIHLSQI